nr:protein 2K [Ilomantsi virus]
SIADNHIALTLIAVVSVASLIAA